MSRRYYVTFEPICATYCVADRHGYKKTERMTSHAVVKECGDRNTAREVAARMNEGRK